MSHWDAEMIKRFLVLPFLMLILVLLPNCSSSEAVQTDPEADMSPVISQEPENEDETVVETLAVAEDDIAEEIGKIKNNRLLWKKYVQAGSV